MRLWQAWALSFAFAFALIAAFIALDMIGVMRGLPTIVQEIAMGLSALPFIFFLSRRQRKP